MPTGFPLVWRSVPIRKPLKAQAMSAVQENGPRSSKCSRLNMVFSIKRKAPVCITNIVRLVKKAENSSWYFEQIMNNF